MCTRLRWRTLAQRLDWVNNLNKLYIPKIFGQDLKAAKAKSA